MLTDVKASRWLTVQRESNLPPCSQYYTRQCLLQQTADASTSGCRRHDLLGEPGGLVYKEEGLDIEVPLEPVTLPALGRAERLGWETAKGHVFITLVVPV